MIRMPLHQVLEISLLAHFHQLCGLTDFRFHVYGQDLVFPWLAFFIAHHERMYLELELVPEMVAQNNTVHMMNWIGMMTYAFDCHK